MRLARSPAVPSIQFAPSVVRLSNPARTFSTKPPSASSSTPSQPPPPTSSHPSPTPPSSSSPSTPPSRPPHKSRSKGPEYFVDVGDDGLLAYNEREYIDPTSNPVKGAYTPLARELHEQIKVRGPLTLSDFMYQCMQNPKHGYYMTKRDVIGAAPPSPSSSSSAPSPADSASSAPTPPPATSTSSPSTSPSSSSSSSSLSPPSSSSSSSSPSSSPSSVPLGDFITSPEISQLFGEMLGVWLVDVWQKLGRPPSFHLVELGPGRGTLASDVLRVFKHFSSIHAAVHVHLVETSPLMREVQRETLGVTVVPSSSPFYSPSLILPSSTSRPHVFTSPSAQFADQRIEGWTADRVRVTWHTSLKSLPTTGPVMVVGHEFLDAMPVYQFVWGEGGRGWTEVLVDSDYSSTSPYHFRFCLAPAASPAASALMTGREGKDGDRAELGIAALAVVEDVTQRVGAQGGCALFIDYGFTDRAAEIDGAPLTLQAVQQHRHVHPLHEPGWTDLTTLVDFSAMSAIVARTAAVKRLPVWALPVITQGGFLRNMGIAVRLERLVEGVEERGKREGRAEEEVEREVEGLMAGATRLVSEGKDGMGKTFKVLGIVHEKVGCDVAAWDEREVRAKRKTDAEVREKKREEGSLATSAMKGFA